VQEVREICGHVHLSTANRQKTYCKTYAIESKHKLAVTIIEWSATHLTPHTSYLNPYNNHKAKATPATTPLINPPTLPAASAFWGATVLVGEAFIEIAALELALLVDIIIPVSAEALVDVVLVANRIPLDVAQTP